MCASVINWFALGRKKAFPKKVGLSNMLDGIATKEKVGRAIL